MAELEIFWREVTHVWEEGVFGVDVGRVSLAILILLFALVLRQLFTRFFIGWLKSLAAKTRFTLDEAIIETLEPPIRFIPVVLGVFLAAQALEPEGEVAIFAHNLIRSLIAYTIFWSLYCTLGPVSTLLTRLEKVFTSELVDWVVRAMRVLVIVIGAAAILEIWGIQVGPIIAGFGLFGVAVALGAQDLFKNLIAGLLILGEKRFKKGDWIRADGVVEGTVEMIGFRSTMIRRFDKAPVMVPNAQLSDSAVTNFSEMTYRRIHWKIGVEYRTSVDQLRQIRDAIEAHILEHDDFVSPEEASTFVRIDAFGDSSIDIMVYCFTRTKIWGDYLKVKEDLAYKLIEIVEGAGSGFAFPSTSIYIENPPGDVPEIFPPLTATPGVKKKPGP